MGGLEYTGESEIEQAIGFVTIDYIDGEPVAEIGVAFGQDGTLARMLREVADMLDSEAPQIVRMQ